MSHFRPPNAFAPRFPQAANDMGFERMRSAFQRLERAAIALNAVMQRQKRETIAFKSTVEDLGNSVKRLKNSTTRYQRNLAGIPHQRLHRRAKRLGEIMDGCLERSASLGRTRT